MLREDSTVASFVGDEINHVTGLAYEFVLSGLGSTLLFLWYQTYFKPKSIYNNAKYVYIYMHNVHLLSCKEEQVGHLLFVHS